MSYATYTAEDVEAQASRCQYVFNNEFPAHMLRDYASFLRERESAKGMVTDEMARKANYIYSSYVGGGIESMRAALEAVAPMLASIQSPDMVCEQHPWSEWPHDDCAGPGMPGTTQYEALVYLAKLASARVPDLENALRMVVAANAMLSEIEDNKTLYEGSPLHSTRCLLAWDNLNTAIANAKQLLTAAPKPEAEE